MPWYIHVMYILYLCYVCIVVAYDVYVWWFVCMLWAYCMLAGFFYLVVIPFVCIAIRVGWRLASRDRRRQLGMDIDSGVRMLAGGCYWSSPGGLPLSPPPLLGAGGCALI